MSCHYFVCVAQESIAVMKEEIHSIEALQTASVNNAADAAKAAEVAQVGMLELQYCCARSKVYSAFEVSRFQIPLCVN